MASNLVLPALFLFHTATSELVKEAFQSFALTENIRPLIRAKSISACCELDSSHLFPTWPKSVVESIGNYENELYLEDIIGGHLYSCQRDLPLLPVPSLSQTIKIFLPTCLPLAESKDEEENLIRACENFPTEAAILQERLEARKAEKKETSWLQEWWNSEGYLRRRDSIVINTSYFFPIGDDTTLPHPNYPMSIMRAACALTVIADYRKSVCSGQLPVERSGHKKSPLCSTAFKYMFHTCRIPKQGQDGHKLYDPSLYRHCVVAVDGQFFAMDFVDDNQNPIPLESLEAGLKKCVSRAEQWRMGQPQIPGIGILTGENRETWADIRKQLLAIGGEEMEKALAKLESGAVLICLDDCEPSSLMECVPSFWHGGRDVSLMNRWFDKPVQILCQRNGHMAFLGEHSMIDGMNMVDLISRIENTTYKELRKHSGTPSDDCNCPQVESIFGEAVKKTMTNSGILSYIEKAQQDFVHLVDSQNMKLEVFQQFGSEFIKSISFSPDSFVQMAFQLASYRLFGKQVSAYESTQVRSFLNGRTETTRIVSPASQAFIQRMGFRPEGEKGGNHTLRKKKLSLLRAATWMHSKYLNLASKGLGCDRHFFGLSMLVGEDETSPSLFNDPVFKRSKHWRLSTSSLAHTPGFGCVVDDGIGIGYSVKPNCIWFAISARKENNAWIQELLKLIEEALLEMQALVVVNTLNLEN